MVGAVIGHDPSDEIERALSELTLEQEDELEDAAKEAEGESYWSSRRRHRWLFQEAIRRGWLVGN